MKLIKYYLRYALHMILLYVQDFDGLKDRLHLALDSYNSYYNSGGDLVVVGIEGLAGDWIVYDMADSWHHNPMITVGQYNRIVGNDRFVDVRLSKVII